MCVLGRRHSFSGLLQAERDPSCVSCPWLAQTREECVACFPEMFPRTARLILAHVFSAQGHSNLRLSAKKTYQTQTLHVPPRLVHIRALGMPGLDHRVENEVHLGRGVSAFATATERASVGSERKAVEDDQRSPRREFI